jgi:3-dehydro-4-phosphotetronate decarboxylase
MTSENRLDPGLHAELEALCEAGESFYARGLAHGSTGNLSLRRGGEVFITATGGSLRRLAPGELARIDLQGRALDERRASKEAPFHLAVYRQRPEAVAIVHLHSPHAVALSCLADLDPARPVPAITPYFFMRVAPLGIVPYSRPGSAGLADAIEAAARDHACLLLRNHGLVCAGASVGEAVDRAEELEATARLALLLRGLRLQELTEAQIRELGPGAARGGGR